MRAALAAIVTLGGMAIFADVVDDKYPLEDWLVWRMLPVWGYTLWLNVMCVGVGHLVLTRLLKVRELAFVENALMSMTCGLVTFVLGMYLGGALGLYRPWFSIVLGGGLTLAGIPSLRALWRQGAQEWAEQPPLTPGGRVALALATGAAAFLIGVMYLAALTPASINYDASWYHIPIAQDYAREGRIVRFPSDWNRAFPHLPSMLYTWAYLVPDMVVQLRWMMPLHIEFTIVLWKIVAVAAGARYMLGEVPSRGAWLVFFLFPAVFVYDQNIGGSADHFMGFWAVPIFLAVARTLPAFDLRYCALLAVAAGGALLTKYQAVYMIAATAALLSVRWAWVAGTKLRGQGYGAISWRTLGLAPVVIAGLSAAVWAPHLIKNTVFYGNPLYPIAQDIFTTSTPAHEKSAFFFKYYYPNQPWIPKGTRLEKLVAGVKLFFTYSFEPHYTFNRNFPSIGSLFTLLLPCALLVRRPGRIWLGIAAAFVAMMVWSNTYIVDRYLQGLVPLFAAVTAALIVRTWELGWLARLGLVPLVAFQAVWGADAPFYSGHKRIQQGIDLIRAGFEGKRTDEKRFPWRDKHLEITEATPEDAKIVVRNYRSTLGIDRTIYFDIQPWQSWLWYEPLKDARGVYEMYESRGITHIIWPHGRRPSTTKQLNVLFAEFVHRYAKKIGSFGSLHLAEMPDEAPPPAQPFNVLSIGVSGYPNGLYRVEDMAIYERGPKEMRQKPKPRVALPSRLEWKHIEPLLPETDAIIKGRRVPASARGPIGRVFFDAESFSRDYTIMLRKEPRERPSPTGS